MSVIRVPAFLLLLLIAAACEQAPDGTLATAESAAGQTAEDTVPQDGIPDRRDPSGGPEVTLVDTAIAPGVAGEDGWDYALRAEADFDGDGQQETVVLMARVELYRGRPAWDDGQPWQVYVEEPDGRRTYLYSRYVQLGTVTMRVALPEGDRPPSVILLEHVPDRLSLYEIEYAGPARVHTSVRFQRQVDPRGETASPRLP